MTRTGFTQCLITFVAVSSLLLAESCSETTAPPPGGGPVPVDTSVIDYTYNILNTYPHDGTAFTQGLQYVDSVFVEGTGLIGSSTLRRVEVETGAIINIRDIPDSPPNMFGEGVAVWGDTIVQLTWLHNVAILYDTDTFDEIGRFTYPTQGWGLTHDGSRYIMSDGTDILYFRDRDTFAETGRVAVRDTGIAVTNLNELEYIDGMVYANRYQSALIYIIDPATGRVRGRIDLTALVAPNRPRGVLNGIAWDAGNERLFVTGKEWRNLYHIELLPPQ
jgi:glutamine cyclotransferase